MFIKKIIFLIGELRVALCLVILILIAAAPLATGEVSYSGWALLWTVIVPALVPMFFFIVLLDILMAAIFLADGNTTNRARFRLIILLESTLILILIIFWTPIFMRTLNLN